MSVFFLLEKKRLRRPGSLWELCLIAACVVNYEVHFQRAVQIALWGTAARTRLRRNNTMLNNKSNAAHADCGTILTLKSQNICLLRRQMVLLLAHHAN